MKDEILICTHSQAKNSDSVHGNFEQLKANAEIAKSCKVKIF